MTTQTTQLSNSKKKDAQRKKDSRTLILIRHAHRNKDQGREIDNGLSKKGLSQAKKLKKHFEKAGITAKPLILSSPKLRCIETVERIARKRASKIHTTQLLDEGGDLEKKTNLFLTELQKKHTHTTVVCSHGDVIPYLIRKLTGASIELSKGGLVQIRSEGSENKLEWLIQGF